MRWLIRRVTRKGRDQLSFEDDIHFGEVLTIGRGASQAVFLTDMRVALEHARLTALGSGRYQLESLTEAGVRVDGKLVHQATLQAGAHIDIGSSRLTLLEAPPDHEAGIEIVALDPSEQAAQAARKRLPITLAETRLGMRAPAWALLLAILALALALPIAAHYVPGLSRALQVSPLPSRDAWQAGTLAPAHHFFGSDCAACHSAPFQWVKDTDCQACHAALPAHADPARFHLPALGEARCAHCHRDHNGREGLVRHDQALCADCHTGLSQSTAGATGVADVHDFGVGHPQFKVALPQWDEQGNYTPQRVELTAGLEERSGLKFPHDVHLSPDGLQSPDGLVTLDCADCHRPQAGGALMQPVDFETMCQDCHRLTFDITAPTREVPHGRLSEIFAMLDEFYARRALDGEVADASAPTSLRLRRRPGEPVSTEQRQLAYAWAREKSRQIGESLFTGRACSVCHSVSAVDDPAEPWRVAPVRVADEWFPKARFTHRKHRTMNCTDCHAATGSSTSSDLLLPDIANCRQCHAGEHPGGHVDGDRLTSACIACHSYHASDHLLLRDL